jgi:methyl-accepting chemotaxis protein
VTEAAATLQHTAESFTEQQSNVENSGDTFRLIVQFIEGFEQEISRIEERVHEAKRKQAELVQSVQVVASVAQETAAGVQETAAASASQDEAVAQIASEATDIHRLAEALFEEIDKFKM